MEDSCETSLVVKNNFGRGRHLAVLKQRQIEIVHVNIKNTGEKRTKTIAEAEGESLVAAIQRFRRGFYMHGNFPRYSSKTYRNIIRRYSPVHSKEASKDTRQSSVLGR